MGVVTHTYRFTGSGEDFGPRKGVGLVILHTTEGDSTRITVADALALARWQDRDDTAGSYNRLIASDGCVSTVPDDHASGGVNPFSSYFKPVPWLYANLPASKVNDPNAYALQLSFMGRRAWFDANGWPPAMIDRAARSIIEEEERTGQRMVVANHADFQPGNRTDAGTVAMALVRKRYAELTEDTELSRPWRPVTVEWDTVPGAPFQAIDKTTGEVITKSFSTVEPVTTFTEQYEWVDGKVTSPSDRLLMAAYPDAAKGPEVLIFPRTSLDRPRNVQNGLPAVGGGFTQLDITKAREATASKANAQMDAWTATRPRIVP